MALSNDRSADSLTAAQERLAALEARADGNDVSLLSRVTQLEVELKRATAALRTQGAMLRNSVQDQGVKAVRAREIQALTAAELDGRLTAMEKQIDRLLHEVDSVRQEHGALRNVLGPLRRLGSSSLRRVSGWLPSRPQPAQAEPRSAPPKPKNDNDSMAMLMLRGLPSQVLAWKTLLGKRR